VVQGGVLCDHGLERRVARPGRDHLHVGGEICRRGESRGVHVEQAAGLARILVQPKIKKEGGGYEQALVCLSNRNFDDASRG